MPPADRMREPDAGEYTSY